MSLFISAEFLLIGQCYAVYAINPAQYVIHNYSVSAVPANMRRWLNVGLLSGQRRRRRASSKSTLRHRLMFAGVLLIIIMLIYLPQTQPSLLTYVGNLVILSCFYNKGEGKNTILLLKLFYRRLIHASKAAAPITYYICCESYWYD